MAPPNPTSSKSANTPAPATSATPAAAPAPETPPTAAATSAPATSAAKAEAKAEVKLKASSASPKGSSSAAASTSQPKAAPTAKPKDEYKPQEGFEFNSLRGYTAQLGFQYVTRDSSQYDSHHSGFGFMLSAGPRGVWRQHEVDLKLFLDWQKFSNDLGEGVKSQATEVGVGINPSYIYNINDYVGAGVYGKIGFSIYNAPEGPKNEYGFTDGTRGFQFNENAQLYPLDNVMGLKAALGLQVPLYYGIFRPNIGYVWNVGHNPQIDLVDGGNQRFPFSSNGFEMGLIIDGNAIYNFITGEPKKRAAYYAKEKVGGTTPNASVTPHKTPVPAPTPKPTVAPAAAASAAPAKPTFADLKAKVEGDKATAETAYKTVKQHAENIALQAKMKGSDQDEQMKLLDVDGQNQALAAQNAFADAKKNLGEMEAMVAAMPEGEDKKKADGELKELKKELEADKDRKHYTLYENMVEAYLSCQKVHESYQSYQKKHDTAEELEFRVEAPEGFKPPKKRVVHNKPKTAPQQPTQAPKAEPKKTPTEPTPAKTGKKKPTFDIFREPPGGKSKK